MFILRLFPSPGRGGREKHLEVDHCFLVEALALLVGFLI